jgi:uroporphyrinogen decarboxylase
MPSTWEQDTRAQSLVAEAHRHGGLAPLDVERFWADQEVACRDPFGEHIPQVPLDIMMSTECVYDELGVDEDPLRFARDDEWANSLIEAYNTKALRIVGRRLLRRRTRPVTEDTYPRAKALHDIFEARNEWHAGSWWLRQSAHGEDELSALLDRVDRRLEDLRSFLLPPEWDEAKRALMARGIKPRLYRDQRGPVTFATSIYGTEDLLFLLMLNRGLAARFRDTITRAMLQLHRVLNEEAGYTEEDFPRGFSLRDDNCCLLNPELYEFFGYPILKALFERCSPGPRDWRYQHSDSDMGHLLPILSRLNFSQVNFGPTVSVADIRRHMPRTVIQGQLAPFTFSRNDEENIVLEFLRDFEMTRKSRGLYFATAGSINNGSRLTGMRLIMAAIQRYGRYD